MDQKASIPKDCRTKKLVLGTEEAGAKWGKPLTR
ncbi:hypothetical protein ERICIV_04576 (plasmid) [Paenibacillus larvae subsp. larvae]|uniref:Uncharacterized protein n=1 Tax=Paenibacillus larvae subsp. larvae TaxID=147375 RepID=A0A2L1UK76_9BACL|nr:hypothetical protein ERICIII_04956 [Paenibacillus larvae subsp. larvae]AVF33339.1 hypothetical protein ERICIV_04576 [Paenibacillus larvae subsp. larvae]